LLAFAWHEEKKPVAPAPKRSGETVYAIITYKMPVFILYRPNSDHERAVTEYARDFFHETGHELELVSTETKEGAEKAKLYDIVRYPTVVATAEDGRMLQMWQEDLLPLRNEVAAYLNQG
jgi:hypothetical protein